MIIELSDQQIDELRDNGEVTAELNSHPFRLVYTALNIDSGELRDGREGRVRNGIIVRAKTPRKAKNSV